MTGKPLDPFPYAFVDYDGSVSRITDRNLGFEFSPRIGYSQYEEDYS